VAGAVGAVFSDTAQWGRTSFVQAHWASRSSLVATRPSGHKKGFLGLDSSTEIRVRRACS